MSGAPGSAGQPVGDVLVQAALAGHAFVLMAVLLIGVFTYARALGTEDVMKVAAR